MPTLARMFARKEEQAIGELYRQSTVWMTVISFPVFLLTFSLAPPLTLLLFGERYAEAGWIMAILALGYYFNSALGFSADTLRIYGKFRYTIIVDVATTFICLVLGFLLIPRHGAMGAAIATCATLVIYNILNQIGLKFATQINLFDWHYLRVYLSIIVCTSILSVLQLWLEPPIYIGILLAGIISLVVLLVNRAVLNVEHTFPELFRFRIVQILFASPRNKR
jgi:O-antigen/teichoic acid export membrane protein